MIVHSKVIEKRNSKLRKPIFYRISFSQKPIPKNVSMGYAGEIKRNVFQFFLKLIFYRKTSSEKPTPKIVSKEYTGNLLKQNLKAIGNFLHKNHVQKKLSQRSYQWGTKVSN